MNKYTFKCFNHIFTQAQICTEEQMQWAIIPFNMPPLKERKIKVPIHFPFRIPQKDQRHLHSPPSKMAFKDPLSPHFPRHWAGWKGGGGGDG